MASPRDVQKILHRYARTIGGPRLTLGGLREFVPKFVRRYVSEQPALAELVGESGPEHLDQALLQLEQSGVIELDRDESSSAISSIYYVAFYSTEIQRWYARMSDNRDLPFPTEETLGVTIAADVMQTVEVADNLMHWIESTEESLGTVLLLRFPNNVNSILTTVRTLRENTTTHVLARIRDYLRTDKNAGFLETKMRTLFPSREMLVHDEIETAQIRPDDAMRSILNPNDFQFHFWTQLSSMIIKDYGKKGEKLDMEHGFCQAAYLLGYFAVHYKGVSQRDHQREEAKKLLQTSIQKSPYVFGIQDLYKIVDDRGVALGKKVAIEELDTWIQEMLQRPSEDRISDLVTINTPERNGLVIHSAQYVPLLRRQVKAAGPVLVRGLTNRMVSVLWDDQQESWLEDDDEFERVLADDVRKEFPLLFGLATFKTLFLIVDGQDLPAEQKAAAMSMIDTGGKKMRPWTTILDVDRARIYKDARLQLPVWMVIPVLRGIVRLLRRMFSGTPARSTRFPASTTNKTGNPTGESPPTDVTAERKAKKEAFHSALTAMQQKYLAADQTADQRLRQLRKIWNPLIDPKAQENLVEDVNALCRDSLRRLRAGRTLHAPDQSRIEELAKRIAANDAFDRIRRRKDFRAYLELYMLTVLQRM